MAAKDPNRLFDLLDNMRESMESLIEDAQTLVQESAGFTGEISRVMKQQLVEYFIPTMQKLIEDGNTPGSIFGLQRFLGSVPLAMTREKPQGEDNMQSITPDNVRLVNPASGNSSNPVDALPQNASYAKGTNMPESRRGLKKNSKLRESNDQVTLECPLCYSTDTYSVDEIGSDGMVECSSCHEYFDEYRAEAGLPPISRVAEAEECKRTWQVVRCSRKECSLDAELANLKDSVVSEFNCKEDADKKADMLNKTVSDFEKDAFGTEYKVVEYTPKKIED